MDRRAVITTTGVGLGAFVLVLSAAIAAAQAQTNFAGRWTADRPAARAGGGGEGGGGEEGEGGRRGRGGAFSGVNQVTTITQDASKLVAVFPQGASTVTLTYNLDGTETKNTVPTNFAPETQTSRAAWEGDKLVVVTTTAAGVRQTRTLSLVSGKLVVETSTPGAGGAPVVSRQTYTKGPDAPPGRGGRGRGGEGGRGGEA
jgi:hypothetical protein